MHNIISDATTLTYKYTDARGNENKLVVDLEKFAHLFTLVGAFHDQKRIVDKRNFDKTDLRVYKAVVENVYEALGDFYFAMLRNESPSQDPIRKALQTYLNLWHKDWIADNRFVIALLPFVGSYRNEHNAVICEQSQWVDEVRKVFKQSASVNAFSTNIERMLYDMAEGGNFKTFSEVRAEKRAKAEAKKAAKQAEKEAAEAKNVQA